MIQHTKGNCQHPDCGLDRYTPLSMQIDRLQANRLKITGFAGDEAVLDENITALREQVEWLRNMDAINTFRVEHPMMLGENG